MQSPQTNIVEALLFSAKLRINGDIDRETLEAYVDEVMDLVELSAIRGVIVSPCSLRDSATAAIAKPSGELARDLCDRQMTPEALTGVFRWACRG